MAKNNAGLKLNILLIVCAVFALSSVTGLVAVLINSKPSESAPIESPVDSTQLLDYTIMDSFDSTVTTPIAQAHEALQNAKRIFRIPDDASIAPMPNDNCYGESTDPATLQWLLDAAAALSISTRQASAVPGVSS